VIFYQKVCLASSYLIVTIYKVCQNFYLTFVIQQIFYWISFEKEVLFLQSCATQYKIREKRHHNTLTCIDHHQFVAGHYWDSPKIGAVVILLFVFTAASTKHRGGFVLYSV
jgi:hypothetical protein